MKYYLIIVLILSFNNLFSQGEDEVSTDPVGKFDRNFLQIGEFGESFSFEYENYLTDLNLLGSLEKNIYKYDIQIVLGTWCHDSQEQVPRFIKILDKLNYKTKNLEIICVDREKTAGYIDISDLNIELVPTFIFYQNGIEKGRIIETPLTTLENDMINIIKEL